MIFFSLKMHLFIWKAVWERGEETERSLTKGSPRPGLGQAEVRNQELNPGFSCGWQNQAFGPPSTDFPGALAGCQLENGVVRTQSNAHVGCWGCRQQVNELSHNTSPSQAICDKGGKVITIEKMMVLEQLYIYIQKIQYLMPCALIENKF